MINEIVIIRPRCTPDAKSARWRLRRFPGSDAVKDVAKCLEHCKAAL
jgi:hypothetical protein